MVAPQRPPNPLTKFVRRFELPLASIKRGEYFGIAGVPVVACPKCGQHKDLRGVEVQMNGRVSIPLHCLSVGCGWMGFAQLDQWDHS